MMHVKFSMFWSRQSFPFFLCMFSEFWCVGLDMRSLSIRLWLFLWFLVMTASKICELYRLMARFIFSVIHIMSRRILVVLLCLCFAIRFFLQVPVGRATLGRIINVLGEPIDGKELSKIIQNFTYFLSPQWNCIMFWFL